MPGRSEVMSEVLRQTIRDLLHEELHKIRQQSSESSPRQERVTEEVVAINSNQDLARFVRRILALSSDSSGRTAIESGRHLFRLDTRGGDARQGNQATPSPRSAVLQIEKGVITEKQAMQFPEEIQVIQISKGVQLTPLANDVIRRSGKKIERLKQ